MKYLTIGKASDYSDEDILSGKIASAFSREATAINPREEVKKWSSDAVALKGGAVWGFIKKMNPYHDATGAFTSKDKAVSPKNMDMDEGDRLELGGTERALTAMFKARGNDIIKEMKRKQKIAEKTLPKGVRYDIATTGEKLPLENFTKTLGMWAASERSSAERNGLKYGGPHDFVLGEGKEFHVPSSPPPIKIMTPKECFRNSAQMIMDDARFGEGGSYEYVEGFVQGPELPFPILHAWLANKTTGEVVDPTLGWNPTSRYFGVPFKTKFLYRKLSENGYYGLFTNGDFSNKIVLGQDKDYVYKS